MQDVSQTFGLDKAEFDNSHEEAQDTGEQPEQAYHNNTHDEVTGCQDDTVNVALVLTPSERNQTPTQPTPEPQQFNASVSLYV